MHKLRLKFSKKGPIKFIGHLDVMRYFQKAIRRADIDIKYSEGFSPHQLLSFAQPLSVGATSDGEYLDMVVNSFTSEKDIMDRLNSVCNEGITIRAVRELDEKEEKAMTLSFAAKYEVRMRQSSQLPAGWTDDFMRFLSRDKLPAMKKTKSGEKEIDMKPMIFDCRPLTDGDGVELILSMNSKETLKVSLLFQYFFESCGLDFSPVYLNINRADIYRLFTDPDGRRYIEPFIPANDDERFYLDG
ncbi:MAG: TIGR03936 family radical SAM-associated protein [Butyrivibrio sp.]|nr:TIGR03936 family radical SAM-associated protein [Butyrivibrio sp.]